MWLAVGWPSADKAELHASSDTPVVAEATTTQAVALPLTLKPDAAVEPEEPFDEPPAPAPAAPPPPASTGQTDFLPANRGPVDEYQRLYDRHARDSHANIVEDGIREAFTKRSPDLLHSLSCREQVCKLLIRWTPERMKDYVASMRTLALGSAWPPGQPGFESQIAINNATQTDADGSRLVEIFLHRRDAEAPKPSFHQH
jgi:hypothetical protein